MCWVHDAPTVRFRCRNRRFSHVCPTQADVPCRGPGASGRPALAPRLLPDGLGGNRRRIAELLSDLDATVAWAKSQGGDTSRLGIMTPLPPDRSAPMRSTLTAPASPPAMP